MSWMSIDWAIFKSTFIYNVYETDINSVIFPIVLFDYLIGALALHFSFEGLSQEVNIVGILTMY